VSQVEDAITARTAVGSGALIGYLPVGFPDLPASIDAAVALVENGVDVLELGLPYSDPVMDGSVIQRATQAALANGFRLQHAFEAVAAIRARVTAPVLLMTYWNPITQFGVERFSDQLVALALEMQRSQNPPADPLNIVQIARYAAPDGSASAILLGNLLAGDDRLADALAAYRSVGDRDPLKTEALDSEVRALLDAKRFDEALAVANRAASARDARSDDFARLGDAYSSMKRYAEAASAYSKAVALAPRTDTARIWPILLLQASALQSANRWPEAKAVLGSAIGMAPNEPLVLNFLGYAKLVHGEDLKAAEALIRRASALAPDDASITDSLGWALYKLGKVDEAIVTLQKAAIGDPAQAEIQEHLGDALYRSGRRYEARFAWNASLVTAEDEVAARVKAKLTSGLTPANAAP